MVPAGSRTCGAHSCLPCRDFPPLVICPFGHTQKCLRHVGQKEVRWVLVEPAELSRVASHDATRAAFPVTGNSARNRNTPPSPEPSKYWAKSAVASVRIAPGAIGLPPAS